jgi:hypothetical protein
MASNKLRVLKKTCDEHGIDMQLFAYSSFLTIQLGEGYKPTIDQLDDLYCGLVGGVLYNLGSGKTPEYMEGVGPKKEDRNTLESWKSFRYTLIHELGGVFYPYEEWKKDNPENEDWVKMIEKSMKLDEEFEADPNKWALELREKCKSKI